MTTLAIHAHAPTMQVRARMGTPVNKYK